MATGESTAVKHIGGFERVGDALVDGVKKVGLRLVGEAIPFGSRIPAVRRQLEEDAAARRQEWYDNLTPERRARFDAYVAEDGSVLKSAGQQRKELLTMFPDMPGGPGEELENAAMMAMIPGSMGAAQGGFNPRVFLDKDIPITSYGTLKLPDSARFKGVDPRIVSVRAIRAADQMVPGTVEFLRARPDVGTEIGMALDGLVSARATNFENALLAVRNDSALGTSSGIFPKGRPLYAKGGSQGGQGRVMMFQDPEIATPDGSGRSIIFKRDFNTPMTSTLRKGDAAIRSYQDYLYGKGYHYDEATGLGWETLKTGYVEPVFTTDARNGLPMSFLTGLKDRARGYLELKQFKDGPIMKHVTGVGIAIPKGNISFNGRTIVPGESDMRKLMYSLDKRGVPWVKYNGLPTADEGNLHELLGAPAVNQDAKGGEASDVHADSRGGDSIRAAEEGGEAAQDGAQQDGAPQEEVPQEEVPQEGGPRIIINPEVFNDKRDALCVAMNEAFRIIMEMNGFDPVSEPTPAQRRFFADTAYADDEVMLRRTIIARICTFDTSIGEPSKGEHTGHSESTAPTDEQIQEAIEFLHTVLEIGAPQNEWEQSAVQRIIERLESGAKVSGGAGEAPDDPDSRDPRQTQGALGGGMTDDELAEQGLSVNENFGKPIEELGKIPVNGPAEEETKWKAWREAQERGNFTTHSQDGVDENGFKIGVEIPEEWKKMNTPRAPQAPQVQAQAPQAPQVQAQPGLPPLQLQPPQLQPPKYANPLGGSATAQAPAQAPAQASGPEQGVGNKRAQAKGIHKDGNNYVDANGRRIGFSDYSWYGLS